MHCLATADLRRDYHGCMKVLLASPRGFCAGVNMAIESLDLALGVARPPIYVYHEIVHNKYVVEHFRGRGVTFVDDLAEVPVGATLLFSAHGVSPEIRRIARERKLRAIDATCPLVTKVHLEAVRYAKRRLHDRADRPRRARRSDRHDGRSARGDRAGRVARGRGDARSCRRAQSRLPDADDAQRRRRQPDHRPAEAAVPAHRGPAEGRHLLRHAEPPGGRRDCWPTRPTWCSCSAARTARTASGWPSWPASAAFRAILSMAPATCSRSGSTARRPCSSPPAPVAGDKSSNSASIGSANDSMRRSNRARFGRRTFRFRCRESYATRDRSEVERRGLVQLAQSRISILNSFTKNAQRSAAFSIYFFTGVPAPWPARVSMRSRIGASPLCARCMRRRI